MIADVTTILALVIGLTAMGLAIRRQRSQPAWERRETVLEMRVDELETKLRATEATVATLQKLLYEKQQQIEKLQEQLRQLERGQVAEQAPAQGSQRRVLLVGVGPDSMLQDDLAQLRRVQAQTNVRISRLLPVSKASLERTLERHRAAGTPVKLLHLAVHSEPTGLQFADGLADGHWLSQHLAGVEVALLAGCNNDQVADLLRVVPAVVSMREEVANHDAAIFAGAFWMAVGQGMDVNEAFERALQRAPATVGEFVELHL